MSKRKIGKIEKINTTLPPLHPVIILTQIVLNHFSGTPQIARQRWQKILRRAGEKMAAVKTAKGETVLREASPTTDGDGVRRTVMPAGVRQNRAGKRLIRSGMFDEANIGAQDRQQHPHCGQTADTVQAPVRRVRPTGGTRQSRPWHQGYRCCE